MIDVKYLQIYGQYCWHDDAVIVGDKKALLELRSLIDKALSDGEAISEVFVTDGEGYSIAVVCEKETFMKDLPMPYTAEHAHYGRSKMKAPCVIKGKVIFPKRRIYEK